VHLQTDKPQCGVTTLEFYSDAALVTSYVSGFFASIAASTTYAITDSTTVDVSSSFYETIYVKGITDGQIV